MTKGNRGKRLFIISTEGGGDTVRRANKHYKRKKKKKNIKHRKLTIQEGIGQTEHCQYFFWRFELEPAEQGLKGARADGVGFNLSGRGVLHVQGATFEPKSGGVCLCMGREYTIKKVRK